MQHFLPIACLLRNPHFIHHFSWSKINIHFSPSTNTFNIEGLGEKESKVREAAQTASAELCSEQ